jgi:hypothetical protein
MASFGELILTTNEYFQFQPLNNDWTEVVFIKENSVNLVYVKPWNFVKGYVV